MRAAAAKLKSRRGASILMGLLLLLVCAMAGAAALTAATSNAGRYTHARQDQQRYLAVASAARLVRDELCAGEYNASAALTEHYTHYSTTDPETGAVSWHTVGPEYSLATDPGVYTGAFQPWLEGEAQGLFLATQVPDDWYGKGGRPRPLAPSGDDLEAKNLSVQADAAGAEPLLSQVKWELTMDADYNLTARFRLEETDGAGNTAAYYVTTLTIPAEVETTQTTDGPSDDRVTTQSVTVTWPLDGALIRQG